jgi:hypothetical protein
LFAVVFSKLLLHLIALGLAFNSMVAAAEADGFYRPTQVSGSVRFAGRTYDLPLGSLREALLTKGIVPVTSNRIPIRPAKWGDVLNEMNLFGIHGKTNVSAPSSIVLHARELDFAGKAPRPVVVRLKGKYKHLPVTITMSTSLKTTVEGDVLKMNSPLRIKLLGITLNGSIRMVARRMELPH